MLHKLSFKIKVTIYPHKNCRKGRLKRKTNLENKQANSINNNNKQNEGHNPTHFSE